MYKNDTWYKELGVWTTIEDTRHLVTVRPRNRSWSTRSIYKKLSYRRETARQLPTWRRLSPPVHSPSPSGYTYAYGRIQNPQQTYAKRAVRKAHFKLNRAFKVIQGYPYLRRQEPRAVYCRICPINAAVIPETYEDMARNTEIRRLQRPHSSLKTSQQETPSNIYKRFILPETRVIDLHFCRW